MMASLSACISGLSAFSEQISVISNNVANTETTAYKSSSTSFADMLSQSLASGSNDSVGTGVTVSAVSEDWTQGSETTTNSSTDLCINGSGFFILSSDSTGETYYTRDGSFEFDSSGTLVNSSGLAVQGYVVEDDGSLGSLQDIVVSYDASPASATTEISTTLNLDADEEDSGTYATSVTVYDSLGNEISLTIEFTKTTDNEWSWSVSSSEGTASTASSTTLEFSTSGALTSDGSDENPVITITDLSGAEDMTITWDIYDESTDSDGTTTSYTNGNITQYARDSALYDSSQDGYTSGELSSVSIGDDGMVTGTYSNGDIINLYQIALADFNDYNSLTKVDGNTYQASASSGDAIVGIAGTSRFGTLSSGSLEGSNVDLSTELANLITAQRAYQACSKVFSASDEILQTLIKM